MKKLTLLASLIIIGALATIGAVVWFSKNQNTTSLSESSSDAHHVATAEESLDQFNQLMGKTAPPFTLESFDGQKINLESFRGKKVVLFFTEGVMCYPSCWNQIAAFGKDSVFKSDSVATLVVTVDSKSQWKQAVDQMPELASMPVLLDTNRSVSQNYGVLTLPSSMHKGQFPGHTYLILDKDGIVRYVMDDVGMGVRNTELKAELEKIN